MGASRTGSHARWARAQAAAPRGFFQGEQQAISARRQAIAGRPGRTPVRNVPKPPVIGEANPARSTPSSRPSSRGKAQGRGPRFRPRERRSGHTRPAPGTCGPIDRPARGRRRAVRSGRSIHASCPRHPAHPLDQPVTRPGPAVRNPLHTSRPSKLQHFGGRETVRPSWAGERKRPGVGRPNRAAASLDVVCSAGGRTGSFEAAPRTRFERGQATVRLDDGPATARPGSGPAPSSEAVVGSPLSTNRQTAGRRPVPAAAASTTDGKATRSGAHDRCNSGPGCAFGRQPTGSHPLGVGFFRWSSLAHAGERFAAVRYGGRPNRSTPSPVDVGRGASRGPVRFRDGPLNPA